MAAVLREFAVDSVACTETWPDEQLPPMGCGIVLAPWPNRVAGARWLLDGVVQQLDITEPAHGNAIHGLLRNTAYRLVDQGDESVTLSAIVAPQHGYPFHLDCGVRYALTARGLEVTHSVTNVGRGRAPFGVGTHPYLRVGDVPVGELTLCIAADRRAVVDEHLIPVGTTEVAGTDADLRAGVRLGSADLDTAFTGLALQDGLVQHRLSAPDGRSVTLWAEPSFGWVQVYTPRSFPSGDAAAGRMAVAIEPMTCAPDALNSGDGLRRLEPGETWSGTWGITPSWG